MAATSTFPTAVGRSEMVDVFGEPRVPRSKLEQRHADLAASVQLVLEESYFALLNEVQRRTGLNRFGPAAARSRCAVGARISEG